MGSDLIVGASKANRLALDVSLTKAAMMKKNEKRVD
jgi:hypothetical protein